jgi:uncharacterized membrane protein HdeD (DUF308 family)
MIVFLHGMVTMGFIIAGLLFIRFWRRTKDRLFLVFALAFSLLSVNQVFISLPSSPNPNESWEFLPRLGAFSLLILAILTKNFGRRE